MDLSGLCMFVQCADGGHGWVAANGFGCGWGMLTEGRILDLDLVCCFVCVQRARLNLQTRYVSLRMLD